MREKLKQLKPIQNMMVLVLLVLLAILTTQTSAIGQTLCDGRVPTILGTAGHDEINGTAGPDVIHGLGGNDIIRGLGGNDVICGGDGQDVIGGGGGNDIVFGENGYDSIWGGHGDDILRGGDGNDNISGGCSGNDRLYGENGNDSLYGRSGVDELYGGEGTENNDSCYDDPGTFIMGCEQFNGDYIPPAPVPKTGLTSCWDENAEQINCEGTGQDGELQKGVPWPDPRFTDSGDGTVIDLLTGLIWLKNANCFGERNWFDALDVSNSLADGECELSDGSVPGDWRLPNMLELYSIIDSSQSLPALPSDHPFINLQFIYYWSSTTSAYATGMAWVVDMVTGGMGYIHKMGSRAYLWPVRGGNDR